VIEHIHSKVRVEGNRQWVGALLDESALLDQRFSGENTLEDHLIATEPELWCIIDEKKFSK
jgi:hypothetical protein